MAKHIYELRLDADEQLYLQVNQVLGTVNQMGPGWRLVNEIGFNDVYVDYLIQYVDLLMTHREHLEAVGLTLADFSLWLLYAYEEQCNLEFDPTLLKKIGEAGLTLCISCWEE